MRLARVSFFKSVQTVIALSLLVVLCLPIPAIAATSFACPAGGGRYEVDAGAVTGVTGSCEGNLVLDSSVNTINTYAFENTRLTSLTIPASVTSINGSPFGGNYGSPLNSINVDAQNPNYSSIDGVLYDKTATELIAYPPSKPGTTFTIPSSVTVIRYYAFASNNYLTIMNIPNTVITIGGQVFTNSQSLITVNIGTNASSIGYQVFSSIQTLVDINVDSSNTFYASISGVLYNKSITTLIAYPIGKTNTSYVAPNTVSSTEYTAFGGARNLLTVDLRSVTSMMGQEFMDSTSIREVTFGDGLTELKNQVFQSASGLKKVTFGMGLTSIAGGAFYGNTALNCIIYSGSDSTVQNYSYPNSVVPVATSADCLRDPDFTFSSATIAGVKDSPIISYSINSTGGAIASFSISPDISNTPGLSFDSATGLISGTPTTLATRITYTLTATNRAGTYSREFTIGIYNTTREVNCGDGKYQISDGTAYDGSDCTGELIFPSDVIEIAREGFRNSAITSLILPANLQTIRYAAFYEATQYPSLVIPNSVTLIESQAFEQGQFTNLTLGDGLTTLEYQVFYRNYGSRIDSITFGTGLTSIGFAAFQNFGVNRLTIPEGVTTLADRAFDALSTKTLILPNSLLSVVAPVTDVSAGTFATGNFDVVKYCGSSSTVRDYPFNVAISCGAVIRFDSNLGTGLIPDQSSNTNTTIRTNTFSRSGFTFAGWNTEPNGTGTPYAAGAIFPFSTAADTTLFAQWTLTPFDNASGNGNVTCSTSGYATITNFIVTGNSNCVGDLSFPSGVTQLANYSFQNSGITSVTIPNTVTDIGMAVFRGATGLTNVTFEAGSILTYIGSAAFERTAIASIDLPTSLTFLGNYVFWSNSALTSITIPSGVTEIQLNSFENVTTLASVTLPSTLTYIQTQAFKGATALTSIVIPNSVTFIEAEAFSNTPAATTYTYCGDVSSDDLVAAGLGGKTRASCVAPVVYVEPTPVPYLKTLTAPKINLKDGKLICTPGTYNAGYTINGVIQGSSTILFAPSSFIYNLLINGVVQTSLAITSSNSSHSWAMPASASGLLITCSVTVSANGITNTDKSSDNTVAVSSALSAQTVATSAAETAYSAAKNANSKAYQKALVDNRAKWRAEITAIRANYFEVVARINSESSSRKMISDKSTALKIMIAAQKKSAADYSASKPAAIAVKEAADKAALDAKKAEIAKASATYGTFIESIGYGVLVP